MFNKDILIKKLKNDISRLEFKINHKKLYNIRNYTLTFLFNILKLLKNILPFLIMGTIVFNSQKGKTKSNIPFVINEVNDYAMIETIYTKDDIKENIYEEYVSDKFHLNYVSKWELNKDNFYERTILHYNFEEKDIRKLDDILNMSRAEIENKFKISDVEKQEKSELTKEDLENNKDRIEIIIYEKSDNIKQIRMETSKENVLGTILYLFLSVFDGYGLKILEDIIIKKVIYDKYGNVEVNFRPITKVELNALKRILELKKENLALLLDSEEKIEKDEGVSYGR